MNKQAEGHLAKAEGYLAKGEEFYRKAATEIVAAKAADASLTNTVIGERFGRTNKWVSDLTIWQQSGSALPTPWVGEQEERGGRNVIGARKLLRDAPLEQVETILASVPVGRRAALATALVAQGDVAEAIHADAEASKVHLRMTDAIVGQAVDRSTDRGRKESRTIRDIDASRHFSDAAKEMADGNAIIFAHSPEGEALDRCDAAVSRVKQYVEQYEEIRGLVLD